MKTKNLLRVVAIFVITALSLTFFSACEEKEDVNTKTNAKSNPLVNTEWKLIHFVDVMNNITTNPTPFDSNSYSLKFINDTLLRGYSSTNTFNGNYTINLQDSSIHIENLQGTEINELYDGNLFVHSIQNVRYFSIESNILNLYYNNNQNYLKFERR
jgi:heat shock protein HslJ